MTHSNSIFAFALLSAVGGLNAQVSRTADIRFSAPEKTLSLGEPVVIEFQVTNRSPAPAALDLGFNREEAFVFEVAAPDGSRSSVKAPQRENRDGTFRIGWFSLGQGESYTQRIRIGEWYSFSKTGTYVITGKLVSPIAGESADRAFTITITDRDPDRLRASCEQLTARALDPTDPGAFDAAVDLGLVKDPLSVPYLEKALRAQRPAIRAAAIEALGRIATLEATEALLSIINGPDDEDRRRSAGLLASIARTTQNREVRERLIRAGIIR